MPRTPERSHSHNRPPSSGSSQSSHSSNCNSGPPLGGYPESRHGVEIQSWQNQQVSPSTLGSFEQRRLGLHTGDWPSPTNQGSEPSPPPPYERVVFSNRTITRRHSHHDFRSGRSAQHHAPHGSIDLAQALTSDHDSKQPPPEDRISKRKIQRRHSDHNMRSRDQRATGQDLPPRYSHAPKGRSARQSRHVQPPTNVPIAPAVPIQPHDRPSRRNLLRRHIQGLRDTLRRPMTASVRRFIGTSQPRAGPSGARTPHMSVSGAQGSRSTDASPLLPGRISRVLRRFTWRGHAT